VSKWVEEKKGNNEEGKETETGGGGGGKGEGGVKVKVKVSRNHGIRRREIGKWE